MAFCVELKKDQSVCAVSHLGLMLNDVDLW